MIPSNSVRRSPALPGPNRRSVGYC